MDADYSMAMRVARACDETRSNARDLLSFNTNEMLSESRRLDMVEEMASSLVLESAKLRIEAEIMLRRVKAEKRRQERERRAAMREFDRTLARGAKM